MAEPQHDAAVRVVDNAEQHRYELLVDGAIAGIITYKTEPDAVVLIHTEVEPKFEGHGLGSRLVAGALDDIRSHGRKLVPICPFVRTYLRRHPEDRDLVRQSG